MYTYLLSSKQTNKKKLCTYLPVSFLLFIPIPIFVILIQSRRSPLTNLPLPSCALVTNFALREAIEHFLSSSPPREGPRLSEVDLRCEMASCMPPNTETVSLALWRGHMITLMPILRKYRMRPGNSANHSSEPLFLSLSLSLCPVCFPLTHFLYLTHFFWLLVFLWEP